MELLLAEIFCVECRGYVHPFLDRCPACGAARASRFAEALADEAGHPSLTDDPSFERAVVEASTKFALAMSRRGVMGAMGAEGAGPFGGPAAEEEGPTLHELADRLAAQLTYRAGESAGTPPLDVKLRVQDGLLTVRDRKGRVLAAVDPALVLAAAPVRSGALHRAPEVAGSSDASPLSSPLDVPHLAGHGLVVAWWAPEGRRQIAVGNPGGIFSTHARLDHYLELVFWIGVLAAASAQSRWRAVGAEAHATELGLRSAPGAPEPTRRREGSPAPQARSVQARLEELESLRAAGLVNAGEYEDKRRQILTDL